MVIRKRIMSHSFRHQKLRIIMGFDAPEQIKKMRWYFHEYDKDDKPSVPHAHSYEGNFKLNPWDGTVYEIINKKLFLRGKAKSKELANLLENEDFILFALKEIRWYKREFPNKTPVVPIQYWLKDNQGEVIMGSNPSPIFEITIEFMPMGLKRNYRRYSK